MFRVCAERCDQCLFSKDKIVSDERRKQLLEDCQKKDKHFTCHKFNDVCCRGFFDAQLTSAVQLAYRFDKMGMKVIEFISPPKKGDMP